MGVVSLGAAGSPWALMVAVIPLGLLGLLSLGRKKET
jgi:hypothetical protein